LGSQLAVPDVVASSGDDDLASPMNNSSLVGSFGDSLGSKLLLEFHDNMRVSSFADMSDWCSSSCEASNHNLGFT